MLVCKYFLHKKYDFFSSKWPHENEFMDLIPKVQGVFSIKTASKQPLLKARWIEQNWGFI
jgi:hypothetical protein